MTLAARFEEGAPLGMTLAARLEEAERRLNRRWRRGFSIINYARPWLSGLKCRSQGRFFG